MSSQDDPTGELLAVYGMLGGLPLDFDQQSPDYQRAFLKRRIPQLQKEIADEEARLAPQQQNWDQRSQLQVKHSDDVLEWSKRKLEAAKKGVRFTEPKPTPPTGGGFLDMLGDVFNGMFSHGQLDAKRKILMDMEARYDALQAATPQPALPPAKPTRQQQIAQIQAEIADAYKQKAAMLADLQKVPGMQPTTLAAVERNFDDQIQKLVDKMSKL